MDTIALGKMTLDVDSSVIPRYSAYYTGLELPAEAEWCLYRDRGDAENRIKELKYGCGIEGFHLKNFWGGNRGHLWLCHRGL